MVLFNFMLVFVILHLIFGREQERNSLSCSQRRNWILAGYNDSVINRRKMAVDRSINPVSFTAPLMRKTAVKRMIWG